MYDPRKFLFEQKNRRVLVKLFGNSGNSRVCRFVASTVTEWVSKPDICWRTPNYQPKKVLSWSSLVAPKSGVTVFCLGVSIPLDIYVFLMRQKESTLRA